MKTRTWVLTSLALFIVAIGTATELPKMKVVQVGAEKALVAFKSSEASPLEITLTNCDGEILYYKKTQERQCEYRKVFDFSELAKGQYCVSVNFGNRSISRNVTFEKEKIAVGQTQRRFEPYFSLEDKKLNVSFLNCTQKPVSVNIYRNGKHVAGLELGNELAIQERLDLSNLSKGEYEIIVSEYFNSHKYIAQL